MSENLEVMHIISALPYGGAETVLVNLIKEQKRLGSHVSLCCLRERGPLAPALTQEGIPVHLVRFRSRLNPFDLRTLSKLIRREEIKVVHTHMYRSNTSGTIAAYLARTPVIISDIQNIKEWDTGRQKLMDRCTAFMKDKITAVSQAVADQYIKATGVAQRKVVVSYNAVDPDLFKEPGSRQETRKSLGCPDDHVLIGILARLVPQKNHKLFLEAAQLVHRQIPKTTFIIVGKGPLQSELEDFSTVRGIRQNVIFTGLRTDIPTILSALDISVLSSLKEGFSLTIIESMAAGLPVVATRVGGNDEAIVHGETGFIVEPRSPEALANAIIRLAQDERLRRDFGRAAEERVRRYFSIDVAARRLIDLYVETYIDKFSRSRSSRTPNLPDGI